MTRLLVISLLLFNLLKLTAQFGGNNLISYQYGKMPGEGEAEFSALYNRFLGGYDLRSFRAGLTIEQFYTPYGERNFTSIAQLRLQYASGPLEVKLGNFYETLGRGLLLRSYEIHGALLEDKSYRAQHYFHRDISGASVRYSRNNFTTGALYGKPLNNAFPPGMDIPCRRPDDVAAIQAGYSFGRQSAGAAIMMLDNSRGTSWYGSANLSGSLGSYISWYTEAAGEIGSRLPPGASEARPLALYAGVNITAGMAGISIEYKYYKDFELGAGFNEPPALVKEHSYRLLNRSTHVSQALNETGYQAEAYRMLPDASVITFNHTLAVNDFGKRFVFREYFAGYDGTLGTGHDFRFFADLAQDPLKLESNRFTWGGGAGWRIGPTIVFNTDFEAQRFERDDVKVINLLFSPGINTRPGLSLSLVTEISNDPFMLDELDGDSGKIERSYRWWTGATIGYRTGSNHNLRVFGGQRRGGPACHSGICYEILDFTGIEIRFTSRF